MKSICVTVLLLLIAIRYSDATVCQRLPPQLKRLIRGIDITELDLIPTKLTHANGFNHPIMEFTCNKVRKWPNPSDPSILYDVPDQVETINSLPGGILDFESNLYKNHEEVKNTMSANVGLGYTPGFFSVSGSYRQSQKAILKNVNTVTTLFAYTSAYEIVLKPYWGVKIGASAQNFIDQFLPNTYQQNPAKYQEFLSIFGTHFFSIGYFGGCLTTKIEITESLTEKMNDNEIKAEAKATFLDLLKAHGGYTGATNKVSHDSKKNSFIHEAYYGGNANLLSKGGANYSQWWNSVARNPWLFGGKLMPITALLKPSPKRDAITQAIIIRHDKAYIEELIRTIDYVSKLQLTNKTLANNYRNQLISLRNQVIPNHSMIISLGTTVNLFAINERNKTAQQCHKKKTWLFFKKKICYTIRNRNPSSSYYESYTNVTVVEMDPQIFGFILKDSQNSTAF
jgi:hypothetical protein